MSLRASSRMSSGVLAIFRPPFFLSSLPLGHGYVIRLVLKAHLDRHAYLDLLVRAVEEVTHHAHPRGIIQLHQDYVIRLPVLQGRVDWMITDDVAPYLAFAAHLGPLEVEGLTVVAG